MKPVLQTILEPPNGNCHQACIASILELSLDAVPNFAEQMDLNNPDDLAWWSIYEDFMGKFGLQPIGIDVDSESWWRPQGWHLIIGKSPRGAYNHVVVGHKGLVIHDPWPDGGGLQEIVSYDLFIALDPKHTAN